MTDLLGEMTAWSSDAATVRIADGSSVRVPLADIVSGKPVPPRPSTRLRVTPAEAERRALAGWPPMVSSLVGAWVLRASGGYSARANSVLAVGDPGRPFGSAVSAVEDFYAAQRLPAWAQVVVDSEEHARFEEAGWVQARPGEADTCFQIASVARASREVSRRAPEADSPTTVEPSAAEAWLRSDARALATPAAAKAVLEGPVDVGFVSVGPPQGPLRAKGRVSCDDDWAGITDVWVDPSYRRRGLALVVMRALLAWAAERGATTAYLQTRGDNPAGLALYDRLGFSTHHEYRYLASPSGDRR